MATKIVTKNSSTASAVPTASDLVQGELAVNVADKRLFTEDNAGAIVELGTNPYNFTANHNGSAKLATTSTGIDVTGTATMDGLEIGDNQWIYAGNGADLKIGHDGTDNIIRAQGSPLYIDANGTTFRGYSPYTKHMDIASNGDISFYEDTGTTPKFFWDASAESLGIGTSSPSVKLDVISSNQVVSNFAHPSTSTAAVNGGAIVRIQNTNATNGNQSSLIFADSTASASSGIFGYNTNHSTHEGYMVFGTRNSGGSFAERMRIDSAGNVGIGTSSPEAKLHVQDNTTVIGNGSSGYATINFHSATTGSARYGSIRKNYDAPYDMRIRASNSTGSVPLIFETSSSAEAMRIDSSGNVGINTSSPAYKLDLNGDMRFTSTSALFWGDTNVYEGRTGNDRYWVTGGSEAMRLDSAGNVGIGTTAPSAKMHVIGDIATSTRVATDTINGYTGGSTPLTIQTGGAQSIILGTNGSERMRLDSSGNLLVGTTTVSASGTGHILRGSSSAIFTRAGGEAVLCNRDSSNGDCLQFLRQGTLVGSVSVSGTNATFNTSSDQRLKENIADADEAGSKVDAIQVRKFDWKADGSHQDYGMIAQELQTVAPEAVSGDADSEEMMGVDYSKLVPMLIKEIQSLRNRVAQLEE